MDDLLPASSVPGVSNFDQHADFTGVPLKGSEAERSDGWIFRQTPGGEGVQKIAGTGGGMVAKKHFLACLWGAAVFCALCYGVTYRSERALMLVAASAPSLAIFIWWAIDRGALERRIARLEARSEIADERRLGTQAGLAGVEHRLEEVEARVEGSEKHQIQAGNSEVSPLPAALRSR